VAGRHRRTGTETEPPGELPAREWSSSQPYGSLFFAAAPTFEAGLPAATDDSRHSVVILRLRGRSDLGTTFMDVLQPLRRPLIALDSKLVIVSANDRIQEQLAVTGITDLIGDDNVYPGDDAFGATVRRAAADAHAWVEAQRPPAGPTAVTQAGRSRPHHPRAVRSPRSTGASPGA